MIAKSRVGHWWKKAYAYIAAGALAVFIANTTAYIFSAPILLWWGMPQSSMSFVGNIIFAPFLSIFLLQCALMLATSLFGFIPQFLVSTLEHTTNLWMQCLNLGSAQFLYGQQFHYAIFIGLLCIVYITGWGIAKSASKKHLCLVLLAGYVATTALLLLPLTTPTSTLKNRTGELVITQKSPGAVIIADQGYFVGVQSPEKNIPFQVKRHLMQRHGTLKIASLILSRISSRILLAINELMITTHISKITLPEINPPQTPFFWRQLSILRKKAKASATKIWYARTTK